MTLVGAIAKFSGKIGSKGLKSAVQAISSAAKKIGGLTGKLFSNVRKYAIKGKELFIGRGSAREVGNLIKRGEFAKAFGLISNSFDPKSLTKASVNVLLSQVRKFPAYIVTRAKVAGKVISQGAEKVIAASKKFANGSGSIKLIETEIQQLPRLSRLRRALTWIKKNKKTIFATLGVVVPVSGIVAFIELYRKSNSGCIRYSSSTGHVDRCKVQIASCHNRDRDTNSHIVSCEPNILPDIINKIKLTECSENSDYACLHCDSSAGDPELDNPAIEYVCDAPTFCDTVAKLMGDSVETIISDIDTIHSGIVSAAGMTFNVLKYAIPVVVGICAIGFGLYVFNITQSAKRQDRGIEPSLTLYREIDENRE
ncbi:Pif-5 protein 2 [Dolichomitus sp. PSUC_FEM 10030005]|nr:Pif-5 protein 2 [Dolichomitus sp. PSUC_FEM 10030005]